MMNIKLPKLVRIIQKNDTLGILFEQNQRSCDIVQPDWSTAFHH